MQSNYTYNNSLIVYSFSKIFEILWSGFTHHLVEIILKSWNILLYFNSTTCKEARGFSTYLCNEHNLHLLCFIVDVLIIFSRYKKRCNPIRIRYVIFTINNLIILRFVIFIYLILQNTMPIIPAIQSKINNVIHNVYIIFHNIL